MSKWGSRLGLTPVTAYTVRKLATEPAIGTDPTLLYGVELEIEGLAKSLEDHTVSGMSAHTDGSLRGSSGEFVTRPMAMRELSYVLNNFFAYNKYLNRNNYSERCSTHIHANCQDLTVDQINTVLTLYMVFERVLFRWVGENRNENIFCVPLHDTAITYDVLRVDNKEVNARWSKWSKYTALNLLPLYTQGTIEFRHLHGTSDVSRILDWANIIGCLFSYARENDDKLLNRVMEMNTVSDYQAFVTSVFAKAGSHIIGQFVSYPDLNEMLENGIISVKYAMMPALQNKKEAAPKQNMWFDEVRADGTIQEWVAAHGGQVWDEVVVDRAPTPDLAQLREQVVRAALRQPTVQAAPITVDNIFNTLRNS